MNTSIKTYLLVFFLSGVLFSLVDMILNYTFQNAPFNVFRYLTDVVLYGALGTLVYFITIVLPKKNKNPVK